MVCEIKENIHLFSLVKIFHNKIDKVKDFTTVSLKEKNPT